MKPWLILGALALAACGQSPGTAATEQPSISTTTTPTPPATALSPAAFVQSVANSDAFQIESSQIAAQQAKNAEVKAFARKVAADHQAVARELAEIAPQAEIAAPAPQFDPTQQAHLNTLRSSSDDEFDDAYLDQQVAAHESAVRAFEEFVNNSPNSPLRQWAINTLPKLQQNLTRAQALEETT